MSPFPLKISKQYPLRLPCHTKYSDINCSICGITVNGFYNGHLAFASGQATCSVRAPASLSMENNNQALQAAALSSPVAQNSATRWSQEVEEQRQTALCVHNNYCMRGRFSICEYFSRLLSSSGTVESSEQEVKTIHCGLKDTDLEMDVKNF